MVETNRGAFSTASLINCAGLFSDRVSRMAGDDPQVMIVPFRGEYYDLIPERASLVRGLIYPVPDPRFPFLGVHFTRRVNGTVDAGPNAVLAFRREGYRRTDFNLRDLASSLSFPGFWRMGAKNWRSGLDEFHRSFSKAAFVRALQRLVPDVQSTDLVPGGAGVRAQAVTREGALVDDFKFVPSDRMLHVLNVPSPAATASIMIGRINCGDCRRYARAAIAPEIQNPEFQNPEFWIKSRSARFLTLTSAAAAEASCSPPSVEYSAVEGRRHWPGPCAWLGEFAIHSL